MATNNQLSFFRAQPRKRPTPRPFCFPWGKGQIVEEASYRGKHHEPCLQLLEFENGFLLARFCSYTLSGHFERNSWIAGEQELHALRVELKKTPRLRKFLTYLLNDEQVAVHAD